VTSGGGGAADGGSAGGGAAGSGGIWVGVCATATLEMNIANTIIVVRTECIGVSLLSVPRLPSQGSPAEI
jgi:hypothetical protein